MGEEEKSNSPERQNDNWLRRQFQRATNVRRRDVIIAQVGEGARNIVVGTRNVQINVNDRNLTLPVLLIPLLLLVVIGLTSYPILEPVLAPFFFPAQMTGPFRIAVTEFGELDADGHVSSGRDGRLLSQWLFDGLKSELVENADVPLADQIEVWHDADTSTAQNFKFGVMAGDTAESRREAAAKLADKIAAHIVIYGNTVTEPAPAGLDLEFYVSPLVNDETASLMGSHRLGRLLRVPIPLDPGDPLLNISVNERLAVRAEALFWLTVGLTQQLQGRSERALETLLRAEEELADWHNEDGKEILHFFVGREQLFLDQLDAAEESFNKALRIAPDYSRATIALGSLFFVRADLADTADKKEELAYLEQAIEHQRHGLELAARTGDALLEAVGHIALAKSYRLLGESYDLLGNLDKANELYEAAIAEADRGIGLLGESRQHRLTAQAFETQGAAYLQQGLILNHMQDQVESRERLELAKSAYENCVDQGDKLRHDDRILRDVVIGQGCLLWLNTTEDLLNDVKKGG